jgi:hypothetical protein
MEGDRGWGRGARPGAPWPAWLLVTLVRVSWSVVGQIHSMWGRHGGVGPPWVPLARGRSSSANVLVSSCSSSQVVTPSLDGDAIHETRPQWCLKTFIGASLWFGRTRVVSNCCPPGHLQADFGAPRHSSDSREPVQMCILSEIWGVWASARASLDGALKDRSPHLGYFVVAGLSTLRRKIRLLSTVVKGSNHLLRLACKRCAC